MDLEIVRRLVDSDIKEVDQLISDCLKSEVKLLDTINDYLFKIKGKRIRPLLGILAAHSCGIVSKKTIVCAAVSEMIHTATLLHDDVADNSLIRRGNKTIQSLFSPAASVLTGDYWLSKALSLLVSQEDYQLMGFYTKAVEDLSEGELFQMQKAESSDTTQDDYINIIARKTSSLFVATISACVYTSGASQSIIESMSNYAYYLGISFQIRDDIFDYLPEIDTGKKSGEDIKEKKITLPLICALNVSPLEEKQKMLELIKDSDYDDESLSKVTYDFVNKYCGVLCAQNILSDYSKKAIESLEALDESEYKKELEKLALYVGTRQE